VESGPDLRVDPARGLLELVVVAAFRVPVAQAGASALLKWDSVLEITPGGGAGAAGTCAGPVPHLGQVPQQRAGIMPG
jgi:hypothetical protein